MQRSEHTVDERLVRSNRRKLLLVIGLFLIPPFAAFFAWKYVGIAGVDATTNTGTLVAPARPLEIVGLLGANAEPLPRDRFRGRWTYVLFANGGCDASCDKQLYLTRQIRLGMNKDVRRVQRMLILGESPSAALRETLKSEHEDLVWAVRDGSAATLLDAFSGEGFAPAGEQVFLVDPLGNLMMFYGADSPTRGMIKDLQKLLKISQIG